MCKATDRYFRECSKIRQIARDEGYILVVDDDELIASLVCATAKHCGYSSKSLSSAEAAMIDIAANFSTIRCVVIDLHLNGMPSFKKGCDTKDGDAVVEFIEHCHREIPYLVYTGDPEAAEEMKTRFTRAIIIQKNGDVKNIMDALGISHSNKESA